MMKIKTQGNSDSLQPVTAKRMILKKKMMRKLTILAMKMQIMMMKIKMRMVTMRMKMVMIMKML